MQELWDRFWHDGNYAGACIAAFFGGIAALLSQLPLGEFGPVGFWLGKAALPIAVFIAARISSSNRLQNVSEETVLGLLSKIPTDKLRSILAGRLELTPSPTADGTATATPVSPPQANR